MESHGIPDRIHISQATYEWVHRVYGLPCNCCSHLYSWSPGYSWYRYRSSVRFVFAASTTSLHCTLSLAIILLSRPTSPNLFSRSPPISVSVFLFSFYPPLWAHPFSSSTVSLPFFPRVQATLTGSSPASSGNSSSHQPPPSAPLFFASLRFNKIATPNNTFQMACGQGSYWLIESPTIFSSMCSPPLSDSIKKIVNYVFKHIHTTSINTIILQCVPFIYHPL